MEYDRTALLKPSLAAKHASPLAALRSEDMSNSQAYPALGRRLRRLRLMLGLSQGEAGSAVGVSRAQWSAYEDGSRRIPYEPCMRMAGMARVTTDWIYRGDATAVSHAILNNIGSGGGGTGVPRPQNPIETCARQGLEKSMSGHGVTGSIAFIGAPNLSAPTGATHEHQLSPKERCTCSVLGEVETSLAGGLEDVC